MVIDQALCIFLQMKKTAQFGQESVAQFNRNMRFMAIELELRKKRTVNIMYKTLWLKWLYEA